MRIHILVRLCLGLIGLTALPQQLVAETVRSPYAIVDEAPATEWRDLDPENTLYITLATGLVVVELFPEFDPAHSANFKALVREDFYDGLTIYRVIDGFVAQGGDQSGERKPRQAKSQLPGEFTHRGPLAHPFQIIDTDDAFATESGFVRSFPVGREGDEQWLLHCPGAFALARNNAPDSGGTEFYVVLGHAPRYLDRNVTVFGMVRHGMEHYQKLNRGRDASGAIEAARQNPIVDISVAADIPLSKRMPLQVMDSSSVSFAELARSRADRPEPWFVYRPGTVDVCGIPVPVRLN